MVGVGDQHKVPTSWELCRAVVVVISGIMPLERRIKFSRLFSGFFYLIFLVAV